MVKRKEAKSKVCRSCGFRYIPRSTTQVVCSPNCAIALNQTKKMKAFDDETRRLKKTIKKRSDYEAEAQKAVNLFIRQRDILLPCISCGREHSGQYHAGHYISVGADCALRYNTLNINRQCAPCNNHLSGNPIPYRKRLIEKIGIDKVLWLEGKHDVNKYSISDLARIKRLFTEKYKRLVK